MFQEEANVIHVTAHAGSDVALPDGSDDDRSDADAAELRAALALAKSHAAALHERSSGLRQRGGDAGALLCNVDFHVERQSELALAAAQPLSLGEHPTATLASCP